MRPSAATLARGRAMNVDNLPDTFAAVIPGTPIDDGEGGTIPGPTSNLNVPCRVIHPGSTGAQNLEVQFAEQLRDPGTILIGYSMSVDLPANASGTLTSTDADSGDYDVAGLVPPGSYSVLKRAILKRTPETA